MSDNSPVRPTRRRVLAALATAGLLGVAGCSGGTGTDDGSTPTTAPTETDGTDRSTTLTATATSTDTTPTPPDDGIAPGDWGSIDPTGDTTYVDDPNWRMLGHDTGNTFTNPSADGPSADPTVQWTANAATVALSESYVHPLIVDGVVYVAVQQESTRDSRNEHHEHFLAIDGDTGEARTVFSVEGYIRAPTIVDGTAYVGVANTSDDTTTVRAYDLETGTERWRQSHRFLVGPTAIRVIDSIVIATLSSVVWGKNDEGEYVVPSPQEYAFDAETGELLWTGTGSETRSLEPRPPVVTDGMTLYPDTTTVRRLESGDVQAKLPAGLDFPVLVDGELYGLLGNRDPDEDNVLVSYDWSSLDHRWTYDPDGNVRPGWAVAVDDVVVVNDRENVISGIDRESGERLWRTTDLWDEYLETMFRVGTRDTVYVVHFGGAVTALDPTDGTIEWQLKTDRMDWDTVTGCALADDLLVTVGYDGTVFAIS